MWTAYEEPTMELESRSETQGAPVAIWDYNDPKRMKAYDDRMECVMLPVDSVKLVNQCGNFNYVYPPPKA
jgi:hypothetical protein